ncbi:MAG: hypothetical protein ACRD37_02390 [Candidatus Acidiferrales bacterium]
MREQITWRPVGRRSYLLAIPFICCGAYIAAIDIAAPPLIYGGLVAGIAMLLVGVWIIWSVRRRSARALSALAGATIKVQPGAPISGDVLTYTLTLAPTRSVGIFEWSVLVSLVESEDEEDQEYWSEIETMEYRHVFSRPQNLSVGQITELTGTVDTREFPRTIDKNENYIVWLTVEVRTNLSRRKLVSTKMKLTELDRAK